MVIRYKQKLYWVSDGLDETILTSTDGHWLLIADLTWGKVKVVFIGNNSGKAQLTNH